MGARARTSAAVIRATRTKCSMHLARGQVVLSWVLLRSIRNPLLRHGSFLRHDSLLSGFDLLRLLSTPTLHRELSTTQIETPVLEGRRAGYDSVCAPGYKSGVVSNARAAGAHTSSVSVSGTSSAQDASSFAFSFSCCLFMP